MADWNAVQYMKFESERTQPSVDLLNRLTDLAPKRILDLGCGPGNSTHALAEKFPAADIIGIDSSEDMLIKAKAAYPQFFCFLPCTRRTLPHRRHVRSCIFQRLYPLDTRSKATDPLRF